MGHELSPSQIRAANAQAQKDLESVDFFTRKWGLDAGFVRGLVIRYAKYEVHERLEKKLYECARLDLMVRKALKEKHVIDALWPSPAPRNLPHEVLAQGVQVRKWYGDMFNKYFKVLAAVDSFELRPEVDQKIKSSGTLMLIPYVDHLVFGDVNPILPIVARGAGYSNAKGWRQGGGERIDGFGEKARFEIRFDAPAEVVDTYTKSVVRQCQCNKCGTKRDVQVVISVDPTPAGANAGANAGPSTASKPRKNSSSALEQRKNTSKTTQRYAPGYNMPGNEPSQAPRKPPRPQTLPAEPRRPSTPEQKKQCPQCTFLNHPQLMACEICQAELPNTTVDKPPSPTPARSSTSQNPQTSTQGDSRPNLVNRHSLSSTLFSIFPFTQQQQEQQQQQQQQHQEHPPKLPPTQQIPNKTATGLQPAPKAPTQTKQTAQNPPEEPKEQSTKPAPAPAPTSKPSTPPPQPQALINTNPEPPTTPLSRAPEMTLMPLTPPPTTSSKRLAPAGLPANLMDDFVPVSAGYVRDDDDEDAGWGEVRRDEVGDGFEDGDDSGEEGGRGGLIDLDEVAREEAGVWGEREEE